MIPPSSVPEPAYILEELLGRRGQSFLSLVRLRDPSTGGHCNRVRLLARRVCEKLGLSPTETANIVMGSCLHDIGKIGMPDAILRKPAPLTPHERAIMNTHTLQGWNILKQIEGFSEVAEMVRHHHERYDGNGYPDQLCGDQISVGARIVAVLDAYDAMASGRCYQKAIDKRRVLSELIKGKGSQFDPKLIELIIPILHRMAPLPLASGGNTDEPESAARRPPAGPLLLPSRPVNLNKRDDCGQVLAVFKIYVTDSTDREEKAKV